MRIIIKNLSVKAYHSIYMIECYYRPLPCLHYYYDQDSKHQAWINIWESFKAINDSVGSNRLVLTLLVFGGYPRMNKLDLPSASIIQLTIAIKKAIDKI